MAARSTSGTTERRARKVGMKSFGSMKIASRPSRYSARMRRRLETSSLRFKTAQIRRGFGHTIRKHRPSKSKFISAAMSMFSALDSIATTGPNPTVLWASRISKTGFALNGLTRSRARHMPNWKSFFRIRAIRIFHQGLGTVTP